MQKQVRGLKNLESEQMEKKCVSFPFVQFPFDLFSVDILEMERILLIMKKERELIMDERRQLEMMIDGENV